MKQVKPAFLYSSVGALWSLVVLGLGGCGDGAKVLSPSRRATAATEQSVAVSVIVDPYCEVEAPTGLSFTVTGPYYEGADMGDTQDFSVKSNAPCTLTVTAPVVTLATAAPGAPGVDYYPTATGIGAIAGEQIGFGLALTNLKTGQYGPWNLLKNPDGKAEVSFSPTLKADLPNARITVNSYMDSARGGRALAPPGTYQTTLTLTVALVP